jgi:transketolase
MTPSELQTLAQDLRVEIIEMLTEAKSGHPGGSLSAIDVMTALWFSEMKGVPQGNPAPQRDHFVLSKGHAVPALYAILAKKGYIPHEELKTLRRTGSRLQGHPDRVRLPIVEASTGSLGQGLSVAQGMAMGLRLSGSASRVFCLVGDGEIQEGQIWESALSAPKFQLSNLCVVLDNNGGQIDGPTDEVLSLKPLAEKWRAFNWEVFEINGHDFGQILQTFEKIRLLQAQGSKKPVFIIANTVKGKGVSFMENRIEWHGVAPKAEEARRAIEEIRRG